MKRQSHEASQRTDYLRFIYENREKHPTTFENMPPTAVYDRDGKIVKASVLFRDFTEITNDDIQDGKANIYDCVNTNNTGVMEAIQNLFNDNEILVSGLVNPLCVKSKPVIAGTKKFTKAVFFPISYLQNSVEYGAVLLL